MSLKLNPLSKGVMLVAIAILIGVGYFFYRTRKHAFLKEDLQKAVEHKTNRLYKVTYDSIAVDEVAGNLFIRNLHVVGDTLRQLQLIKARDTTAQKMLLDIFIPEVRVADFKTARALLSKELQCRQVIIKDPKATVYFFPGQETQQDKERAKQELYKQILGDLDLIYADSILISNGQVVAKDFYSKQTKFSTYNTTINLNDVKIDSTYNEDTSRTLFCKQIDVTSDKVIIGEKNKQAAIENTSFSTKNKVVYIGSFDYDGFKNNGFFKSTLRDMTVEGITWKGPVERSALEIGSIILQKGEIEALTSSGGSSGKNNSSQGKRLLTGWIKSFSLNKLIVKSLSVTSRSTDDSKKPIVIKNNTLTLKNVKIDSVAKMNENLVNRIGEVEFKNDELSIVSKDKMYVYKISGFTLNTKSHKLWIKQVAIIPQLGEVAFAKKSKVQRDRYDVKINNVVCNDVDVSKLFKGSFISSLTTTNNISVKVYRDLSYPATGESNMGNYPQQMLFKLKVPVSIKKFTASQVYVEYKEKNPMTDSSGKVRFENGDITITNISNLTPKAGDKATATFKANFLGALPLTGSFVFYLDEWKKGTFKTEAAIQKPFDGRILNQLSKPMSLIQIDKGYFDLIKCNLIADNYSANGSLILAYHDFKITMLSKKNDGTTKSDVKSLFANLIIKNKNLQDAVRGRLYGQIKGLVGGQAAAQIQEIIQNIQSSHHGSLGTIIGTIILIIGATGIFTEIQDSINFIWSLRAKPKRGLIKLLLNRLLSFSLIVSLGFLLLVSLVASAIMDLLSDRLSRLFPHTTIYLFYILNHAMIFVIISILFAIIFKVLPDGKIKWKDAFVGSSFTAVLFLLGKAAIGYYIGSSSLGVTYGTAASIIIILTWVYYTSIILYFGAEFTKIYALEIGGGIVPNETAVFIIKSEAKEIEAKPVINTESK